jgi:hypothetical protein
MNTIKRALIAIAAMAVLLPTLPTQAAEPDSHKVIAPKYSQIELRQNLGNTPLVPMHSADEAITFTVQVDAEGNVGSITYKSNAIVQAYVREAFKAINETTFIPAQQDDKAVDGTVTITLAIMN